MDINKSLTALNRLDWLVAAGTLVAGIYLSSPWLIAAGFLGFATAWYKPAERIKRRLEKKFLRKKTVASDAKSVQAEDAFYANVLGTGVVEPTLHAADAAPASLNFSATPTWGKLGLNQSPHSVLRYTHLNLATGAVPRTWA